MAVPFYQCSREDLQELIHDDTEMIEHLESSFRKSLATFAVLVQTDLWQGRSKEEFTSFYHLVMQYHGWVAGMPVPSVGEYPSSISSRTNGNECSKRMHKAYTDLIEKMNSFCYESRWYKDLEAIPE